MCLILVAVQKHPLYKLILAANRDEYHDRPSKPPHFWKEVPHLLAGRDLVAGGTWLGITLQGRIAAITNYRDPSNPKPNAPSRGRLAADFLTNIAEPMVYLDVIRMVKDRYNGYNLLLGNPDRLYWYSNRSDEITALAQRIYGLSNHLLDTPWPKVTKAKGFFEEIIRAETKPSTEAIFQLLADQTAAPDHMLPETGVGLEWERILSSIFITSPTYGTRSSTVVLIDKDDNVLFLERTFNSRPEPVSTSTFEFTLKK
ncbi:MAG: NRDE family protein [Deltaproteobacteria bacterium]|nr:NRDE family protein [Deltaproteobacteria bacterium]